MIILELWFYFQITRLSLTPKLVHYYIVIIFTDLDQIVTYQFLLLNVPFGVKKG